MKKICWIFVVVFVLLMNIDNASAQDETKSPEPNKSFRVYTYTVVGSKEAGQTKLPNNLTKAFDAVNKDGGFTNYELISTQYQVIRGNGSVEYKSVLKDMNISEKSNLPILADWNYTGFSEKSDDIKGKINLAYFRFNLRFPLRITNEVSKEEVKSIVNYESLGITARNIELEINKPIIFASLPIDVIDKSLYFVVHIEEVK